MVPATVVWVFYVMLFRVYIKLGRNIGGLICISSELFNQYCPSKAYQTITEYTCIDFEGLRHFFFCFVFVFWWLYFTLS